MKLFAFLRCKTSLSQKEYIRVIPFIQNSGNENQPIVTGSRSEVAGGGNVCVEIEGGTCSLSSL